MQAIGTRHIVSLASSLALSLSLSIGCDTSSEGLGGGDGDGDAGGTPGDGDGDAGGNPGDGDGDAKTGGSGGNPRGDGDGDGDGDTGGTATGDGDGDTSTGGTGNEPECQVDEDCAPATACDSASTCERGACVPGSSVCGDYDTTNCDCVEIDSTCEVVASDADSDGYGSTLCDVAPGDDCDDTLDTVHPGAEEACDGLDNDCDGLFDLDEGQEPFVRRVNVPGGQSGIIAAMAWSPEANAYGIAWATVVNKQSGPTLDVHFGLLHLDGTLQETLTSVILGTSTTFMNSSNIDLAYGDGEFGLAALDTGADGPILRFRRIVQTGTATRGAQVNITPTFSSPQDLDLVRSGPDDWVVSYTQYDSNAGTRPRYATLITSGAVVAQMSEVSLPVVVSAGGSTDLALLPWRYQTAAGWSFIWSAFEPGSALAASTGNLGPTSALSTMFSAPGRSVAVSYPDSNAGLEYFNSVNSQAVECVNVETPYTQGNTQGGIARVADGWAIVRPRQVGNVLDRLVFSRVHADCTPSIGVADQDLAIMVDGEVDPVARNYGVKVAGNGKGLAVMWAEAVEGDPLRVGLYGPNVCDDPNQ